MREKMLETCTQKMHCTTLMIDSQNSRSNELFKMFGGGVCVCVSLRVLTEFSSFLYLYVCGHSDDRFTMEINERAPLRFLRLLAL